MSFLRSHLRSFLPSLPGLLVAASLTACGPTGAAPASAPAAAPAPAPAVPPVRPSAGTVPAELAVDALIFIDLSPSMSQMPAETFGRVVRGVLAQLPENTAFSIRLLESSSLDGEALLGDTIPEAIRTIDKIRLRELLDRWGAETARRVDAVRAQKAMPQGLSCYMKSIDFARRYFEARAVHRQREKLAPGAGTRMVWVGDMIEDCRDRDGSFSGLRIGLWRPGGAAAMVKALRHVPQLRPSTDLRGVIIPRTGPAAREVPGERVLEYWREMLPHLGVTPTADTIGTPELVGVTVTPKDPA
jgi:hypothetical protein